MRKNLNNSIMLIVSSIVTVNTSLLYGDDTPLEALKKRDDATYYFKETVRRLGPNPNPMEVDAIRAKILEPAVLNYAQTVNRVKNEVKNQIREAIAKSKRETGFYSLENLKNTITGSEKSKNSPPPPQTSTEAPSAPGLDGSRIPKFIEFMKRKMGLSSAPTPARPTAPVQTPTPIPTIPPVINSDVKGNYKVIEFPKNPKKSKPSY